MTDIDADVVIVGSGFAGALIADRLARQGIRTAILESGGRVDRGAAFQSFLGAAIKTPESPYPRHPDADFPLSEDSDHWYRQSGPDPFKSTYLKAVGGTSWHWLGTAVRYVPSDFRMRTLYGQAVDWPIDYDELEPFYVEAERELGVAGGSNDDLGAPRSAPFPMPPIQTTWLDGVFARALAGTPYQVAPTPQARNSLAREDRPACCGSSTCIPICPIGAKYDATVHIRRAEEAGAVLHEYTTATAIDIGADGLVSGIRFRRPDGTRGIAKGRIHVLAANAMETPRLLLNSRSDRHPNGVGNGSDQVGRNLMDHPIQLSWALSGTPVWPYRGPISTSGIENLRDGSFRRERSALRIQIANDGWNWPNGGAMTLASKLIDEGLVGEELRSEVADQASRHIQLGSLTEQLPEPNNRVTLDPSERDPHGVPYPASTTKSAPTPKPASKQPSTHTTRSSTTSTQPKSTTQPSSAEPATHRHHPHGQRPPPIRREPRPPQPRTPKPLRGRRRCLPNRIYSQPHLNHRSTGPTHSTRDRAITQRNAVGDGLVPSRFESVEARRIV